MEIPNTDRIIVLVDMDCFYVQVEQKLCPEYQNKPCAVVQYNTWKGGGIIAVNYEARAKNVTRMLRGDEAQKMCPDIHLFRVPEVRGKADLTRYRDAGALVLDVLCEYSECVERASIDEAYLDLTSVISSKMQNAPRVTADQLQNTFVVGWESENTECRKVELEKWLQMIYEEEHLYSDRMLAFAAVIAEEMRAAVYEKTGYRCSAGIAHNKMLAKLSCGIHKPNKQTVLPQASIQLLFKSIPIKKVRNLGGKLGEAIVKKFNIEKMGDLIDISKSQLVNHFGEKTGHWLYNLIRGIDNEPVISRQLPKSIGCGKNFPGKKSLSMRNEVVHWLKQLATELEERLIKDQIANRRFARLLTISIRTNENGTFSVASRSCAIHTYNAEKLAHDALIAINKFNTSSSDLLWKPSIWNLSMAASKFEDRLDTSHSNIESYFNKGNSNQTEDTACTSASTSSESINPSKTSKAATNSSLKSAKNEISNRSIVSFFTKKQEIKTTCLEDVENCSSVNEENKELDSFLSVCNDINSVDVNVAECNDLKNENISTVNETVEKKHKEQSELSFNATLETSCNDRTNESNYSKINETININVEVIPSDKKSKPLGFFAKKLKERSEFSFDIDSEKSCESTNNDPIKTALPENFSNLDASSSFLAQDRSSSSNINVSDTYADLDPELTKLCEECNKCIPVWEETEHLDYHLALTMSKEFTNSQRTNNNSFVSKSSMIGKNVAPKSKCNRKRGSATKPSSHSKKPLVKTKTLDAFFR